MPKVPLADWLPDQAEMVAGAIQVHNVIRTPAGYRPLPALKQFAKVALPQVANGLVLARNTMDDIIVVAGGGDGNLYQFNAGTLDWTNRSKGGVAYSVDTMWNFCEFGNKLIAANGTGKLQYLDTTNVTAGFTDLSADAPEARYVCVIRDQVFAGWYPDTNGQVQMARIGWCAIDDPTNWTPNLQLLSDFQDNPDVGGLMGLVGGSYGVAIFETGIIKITFAGPPIIWQFDRVAQAEGAIVPGSIIAHGNLVFYLSPAGFQQFDGTNVTPIGAEQVDRWFYRDLNMAMTDNIRATIDPMNHTVMWVYAGSGAQAGATLTRPDSTTVKADLNNRCIIYNYAIQKWSAGDLACSALGLAALPGYTLDQLDSVSSSIDNLQASLDSRTWEGGRVFLGAIDYNGFLCNFTGTPATAMLETTSFTVAEMRRAMLQAVYPLVEGDHSVVSAQAWSKGRADNAWSPGPISVQNAEGWMGVRREGRYHKVRLYIDGWWRHCLGVEYLAKPLGLR
jgi:hypothetical protein